MLTKSSDRKRGEPQTEENQEEARSGWQQGTRRSCGACEHCSKYCEFICRALVELVDVTVNSSVELVDVTVNSSVELVDATVNSSGGWTLLCEFICGACGRYFICGTFMYFTVVNLSVEHVYFNVNSSVNSFVELIL
jgi:hypothetical protein